MIIQMANSFPRRLSGFSLFAVLVVAGVWASPKPTRAETSTPPATAAPTKNAAGFYHPGVLVNRAQLEFIKDKVAAGKEPWKSALKAAKDSEFGSLNYKPHPWETCECGP